MFCIQLGQSITIREISQSERYDSGFRSGALTSNVSSENLNLDYKPYQGKMISAAARTMKRYLQLWQLHAGVCTSVPDLE